MKLLFKLLMRIGLISSGPAVSSITSATQIEGTSLVHTVTLASAVAVVDGLYPFSIGGGTATSGTDYTATPTFSAGVTRSGGTLTVPVGVSSFTITVSTTNDTVYEGTETYTVSVGSMSNTGTLTDNDSAPTVTGVSSASATEASSIVHTVTVTGTAQAAQTYAISLSGGTATGGGTDYTSTLTNGAFSAGVTISGGNISVPSGVTSFTVTVPTTADVLEEGNETYTLTIGGASGTGTIVDDDAPSPAFTATMTALSNASGTVTTNAYINAGSGSTLTLSVDESTLSGVAPLAVFFDATGSTSTQTSHPFHDCQYGWDFGDTGAGTWTYGAQAGVASKNAALGPVASHVFETAGTYPVTCAAFDGVSTATTTKTITVTAADTQWASTTVCISTTSDTTGAPAGATLVTNFTGNIETEVATQLAAGKRRILLHRGQTFTSAARILINQTGPGYFGAFGSGAKPIIDMTTSSGGFQLSGSGTPTLSDWRFADLDIDGNDLISGSAFYGGGSCSGITIMRCDMHNVKFGLSFSHFTLDGINASSYTHPIWSKFYVADNTINDLVGIANGSNGMFLGHERSAFMGNYINNNNKGEHGIRAAYESYCVFSHNEITGIPAGRAFLSLRSPEQGAATFPTGVYGTYVYSEKNYVSDNWCYGGFTTGMVGCGLISGNSNGRNRDYIWEKNLLESSATTNESMSLSGLGITARNNIFRMTSGSAIGTSRLEFSPSPDNLWIYNNSIYSAETSARVFSVIANEPGDMSASSLYIKNNIFYGPNTDTGSNLIINLVGATVYEGGNSTNAQRVVSPNFTTTPPTTAAHFKPTTGSYAIALGVSVPVWQDFNGVALSGTRDSGAIKH